jgi:hypothetical protein
MLTRNRSRVKPTRNTPRPAARFGRGILPYVGQYDGRRPYTPEDLRAAARLFGPISDRHDAEMGDDYDRDLERAGRDEPDYALEPIDDDAPADLAEHLGREEAVDPADPDDLDAWDDDPDARAARAEQQELAELGIDPANRGYALDRFGHDCSMPRPRPRPIRDECIDVVQRETWRLSGELISRAEAARRYDAIHRATFARA